MSSFANLSTFGKWRSSRNLVVGTACVALFTETLLGGFPVPMLPYMLEERLQRDPSKTPATTSRLLSSHGFVTMICSPLFAKLFDTWKSSSQKGPLFLSLGLCLVGTALVALTPTLSALYLGRVLQAIAGSAAWLVCTDMITQNAGKGGLGTVMGLSTSFITIGTVSGPMFGGVLLGWFGYWAAWSVPMALLCLDMIARLVVRQPERYINLQISTSASEANDRKPDTVPPSYPHSDVEGFPTETSPLLLVPSTSNTTMDLASDLKAEMGSDSDAVAETHNFYAVMLRDASIWASILNTIVQAAIRAGFNATLPVYLRDTFNWGPSSVGATFFALQAPVIFLSPFLGLVRDRVGVRIPTTVGWGLLCPLLCLLGVPGSGLSWFEGSQETEQVAFIVCICGIGLFLPFVQGAGALHMRNMVWRLEETDPHMFGSNGGRTRCFAMISVSFNTGLTLGPAIAGELFRTIGYLYMNIILGAISLVLAIVTFIFIDREIV
ncbi:hypothetical protein IFR05_010564 [Cadophora sp. M221]|nr:hypothetical protein IFR05_010564 [Cadophora sp. M221]